MTHTKYGDYAVYATRSQSGVKLDKASDEFRTDEFYTFAKNLLHPIVTEPYFFEINNQKIIITSFSVSVIANGEFIGAIGCDISLSELNETLSKIKILQNGFISIMSQNGNLVTHKNKEMLGKPVDSICDALKHAKKALKTGENLKLSYYSASFNADTIVDIAPIKISNIKTNWAAMVATIKTERMKK